MSDEDCTIEKEKNIIELLLEKDLTRICFKIFSHLDSDSFCNSRLVCHGWKDFIDYQFYELLKGIKWRSDKLISNYLDTDFIPREEKIYIKGVIGSAQANEKNIFISTTKTVWPCTPCTVWISNYEFHSNEKLVWSLRLKNVLPQYLHLHNDRLYAYESAYTDLDLNPELGGVGDIYIIGCVLGNIIHKICYFPSMDGLYGVYKLCVLDNKLLAICSEVKVKIYNIETMDKPKFIWEGNGSNIENDGDKLICRNSIIVDSNVDTYYIARNFNTGEKICEIHYDICGFSKFRVQWPYLICTGKNRHPENVDGIRIFDMEKETLIKHIQWNMDTVGIVMKGKIVLIHEKKPKNETRFIDFSDIEMETRFLSFEDIIDDKMLKMEMEMLSSRQIDVSKWRRENYQKYFIVGNCVLRVSTHDIVRRSYWMSINFNNINDNKDKTNTESEENDDDSEIPMKKKKRLKH